MPATRYVRTLDGVDLAYRIFDGGPADLVLVSAYANAMEVAWEFPGFRRYYERLASFARVVEYDGRGSGLSGRTGSPPHLEVRMKDLGVVMDAAGLQRASLFAFVDGAAVAALFAATFPERVSALVLLCPQVRTAWAEDFPWGVRAEQMLGWDTKTWELWNTPVPSVELLVAAGVSSTAPEDPSLRAFLAKWNRHTMTPAEQEAFDPIWMQTDVRDILPSIQAPTIVVYPPEVEEDRGVNAATAAAIPGASAKELPDTQMFYTAGDVSELVDAIAEHLRVHRPAPECDRVLTSILFTDIVGSTERVAELGDRAWREILARHDDTVREQLERFDGMEVDTAGDGFLARFDGPARGVRCAQGIVESVRPLGIEVRAGVHTGEVELVGDRIEGIAVHTGARVAALAGASEVLVSSTVKDLVAGSGLTFEDVGEHELKGVPDRWRLYRVIS
ncbi:MAG: adenylate/guanylate cyclase domain-containing protein [Actinomycetota bacterium]